MIDFEIPQVTTVIRWILRLTLVMFLVWLVKRKPEQEEDDDEDEGQGGRQQWKPDPNRIRQGGRANMSRMPRQRDPYASTQFRNRRSDPLPQAQRPSNPTNPNMQGTDFDSIIEKMSKPKDMWQNKVNPEDESGGRARSALSTMQALFQDQPEPQAVRKPLQLNGKRMQEVKDGEEPSWKKEQKMTLHAHERPVTHLCWNLERNLLWTCGKDKKVSVYNFPDNECLGSYTGHNGAVWSCSVTVDSQWLVSAAADRCVIVWEARNSREVARVELPSVVRFVEWATTPGESANADAAAAGGTGERHRFATCHNRMGSQHPPGVTVFSFDGENIEKLHEFPLELPASQVRWGKNDETLATAHENGELVWWNATSGEAVRRLQAHEKPLQKFDFSLDREILATASTDSMVKLWDLGAGAGEAPRLVYQQKMDRPLNCCALGPLKRDMVVGPPSERPKRAMVIVAGGQDARDVTTTSSGNDQFTTTLLALGDEEEFPATLKAVSSARGHFGPVHTLAFAADGTAMASGAEDGCVRLHLVGDETAADVLRRSSGDETTDALRKSSGAQDAEKASDKAPQDAEQADEKASQDAEKADEKATNEKSTEEPAVS